LCGRLSLAACRLGSHGAGTWALPGGHLEFGESFEECAQREVLEETGLRLKDANYAWAVNSVLDAQSHYVTIFVRAALEQVCEGSGMKGRGSSPPLHDPQPLTLNPYSGGRAASEHGAR